MRRTAVQLVTLVALAAPLAATMRSPSHEEMGAPGPAVSDVRPSQNGAAGITGLPEQAALVLAGTILLGVAAAVRRAA